MYPPRNSPTAAERFQKSWCDPVSIPPSISLSNRREKPRCCRKQWQGRGEQVDYSEPTQPHFVVEADRHSLKLFTVLVGTSSKARKGASWGHVRRLFGCVDPEWKDDRILNGLSSGEGLIWQVRDPITKHNAIHEGRGKDRKVVAYEDVEIDGGVSDKRLLVVESEFCRVLNSMKREGNILSVVIRNAWDQDRLQTLTKTDPATATGAHISIIGHITRDELCRNITRTEAGNGFGNRFLWMCVKRSKCLPEGGALCPDELNPLIERLRAAVTYARQVTEIRRDEEALELWKAVYPALSKGGRGMVGAMTSRGEAQVMRLACIYSEGQLSRFMHGQVGLSLSAIDRLCRILGLSITVRKSPKRKGR
jgi:hypothetical protein